MEGIEGERNEQQSDRAENHHQHGLYLSRFEVEKLICLIKNALWLYSELCFLPTRGAHFQKNHEKQWFESERWSQHIVGYIKISSKLCRVYQDVIKIMSYTFLKSLKEATCSNNTHICDVF